MTWPDASVRTSKQPSLKDRLKMEAERVAEIHHGLKRDFLRRERHRKHKHVRTMDRKGNTSERA